MSICNSWFLHENNILKIALIIVSVKIHSLTCPRDTFVVAKEALRGILHTKKFKQRGRVIY